MTYYEAVENDMVLLSLQEALAMSRPAKIIINGKHLAHNYALAKQQMSTALSSQTMAVVKADAYGHGAEFCVSALTKAGVDGFAVACVDEALAVRAWAPLAPIMVLEGAFDARDWRLACEHRLQLVVHQPEQLAWLAEQTLPAPVGVWLKINTGMHRLGFSVSDGQRALTQLLSNSSVDVCGVMMHHACADEATPSFSEQQLATFYASQWHDVAGRPLGISTANSAVLLADLDGSHTETNIVNRAGVMLYGSSPFAHKTAGDMNLKPVMSVHSRVIAIQSVPQGGYVGYGCTWQAQRETTLAVVAMGYGDGYPRHAPSGTPVWVAGKVCPLVGRVSMDMLTVDVTDHASVAHGAPVELWGEHVSVDRVAASAGTISYELLCQMTQRPQREYI